MANQLTLHNRLLARIDAADFDKLAAHLEPCICPRGMIVARAGEPIVSAYFLESGVASIVAQSPKGRRAEAGIIGRDGFVHPALLLSTDRIPHGIEMQLAGTGHRIGRAALLEVVETSATLRRELLLFAQAYSIQGTFTGLSNAVHHVDERLARWLLMCHDRSESNGIALTHHFLGTMLSVRRASVTNSLRVLADNGFIKLSRGSVTVRRRAELEEFAGDAYGRPEAEYRRLLGPL